MFAAFERVNRKIDVVGIGSRCSPPDADVERTGGAVHLGALSEVDHTVGLDQSVGDQSIPTGHLKAVEVSLVELEEQATQIGVAEDIHGEVDRASFYAVFLVLDRGDLHARIARAPARDRETYGARTKLLVGRRQRWRQFQCE